MWWPPREGGRALIELPYCSLVCSLVARPKIGDRGISRISPCPDSTVASRQGIRSKRRFRTRTEFAVKAVMRPSPSRTN